MSKIAYTLKKKKGTDELHLFNGSFTDNNCTSGSESICKKMKKSESSGNIFNCQDEDKARIRCAKKGRGVCGICVSHLYESY